MTTPKDPRVEKYLAGNLVDVQALEREADVVLGTLKTHLECARQTNDQRAASACERRLWRAKALYSRYLHARASSLVGACTFEASLEPLLATIAIGADAEGAAIQAAIDHSMVLATMLVERATDATIQDRAIAQGRDLDAPTAPWLAVAEEMTRIAYANACTRLQYAPSVQRLDKHFDFRRAALRARGLS